LTFPMLNSVAPETSVSLRSATPSENRWWPSDISLRAPLRSPGIRPSERGLPRPKVGSHTRRLIAPPTVFLQKVAQGHRFPASAGPSAARDRLAARNGLSPGRYPEASVAPLKGFEGQQRCTLRKPSMACQRLGPGLPCPLNSGVPSVVQLQQQGQAVQPGRSSGRLRHSQTIAASGRCRFEERRGPSWAARLAPTRWPS
jgi:hypothetical protein